MLNSQNSNVIRKCALFKGIDSNEVDLILNCLQAQIKDFPKNTMILEIGQKVDSIGIVMQGSAFVERVDCWGNRSILNKVEAGDMFAESLCCAELDNSHLDVVTTERCKIMFIDYKRIITTCSSACVFHTKLIENMLGILARKNIMLTGKIEHLTRRTTREKVLSYLSNCSMEAGSLEFDIPFNRQQLADFLAVDRSALSNELSKLRDEEVLEFNKNHFVLYELEQ